MTAIGRRDENARQAASRLTEAAAEMRRKAGTEDRLAAMQAQIDALLATLAAAGKRSAP